MHVLDPDGPAQFADDASLHTALIVLAQQGWQIVHAPGISGHGSALGDNLFHLKQMRRAGDAGRQIRNILNRAELIAFAFGIEHAHDPFKISSPSNQQPADPLDVIDWHGGTHQSGTLLWSDRLFLGAMVVLGLSCAVLTLIGAAEVIDSTAAFYRSF